MPSLPTLTLPNTFTLITTMKNSITPEAEWRNTYDIHATTMPGPTDPIILGILQFQAGNLRTECEITHYALRNWSQGPQPFATRPNLYEVDVPALTRPGQKASVSPTGYGGQSGGTQIVGGEVVMFVKRLTSTGKRPTNMFIRACLDDGDVFAFTGGKYVLLPGGRVTASAFQAIKAAQLGAFIGGVLDPGLVIVHVGNHHVGPAFSSPITDLIFENVSLNKQTRKNPE